MSQTTTSRDLAQPAGPGEEQPALSREDVFETLSNRRRRYTLHCLKQNGEATSLGEVSEQVAAWETDQSVPELSANERKRVYTSLQQFHLPKMHEKNIVNFDDRGGVVELGEGAQDVDIYMEVTDKYDVPWSYYYLGLTGIGTVLFSMSWLGFPPFASLPDAGWVAFLLTALALSAIAHTILTRRMRVGNEGKPPDMHR